MFSELHIEIFQRLSEGDVNSMNGWSCHILKLFFHFNPSIFGLTSSGDSITFY